MAFYDLHFFLDNDPREALDEINYLAQEIENLKAQLVEKDDIIEELMDSLEEYIPEDDMFHVGCHNFPNCDEYGCGESK